MTDLIVIAKEPLPGRSKTRLTPPCTEQQAAVLAAAALADTLVAVAAAPARRRLLVLDGEPGDWLPPGFEVAAQVEGGLGRRLADAFSHVSGRALLIGMDTPQVTPGLIGACAARLEAGAKSVLGPAGDGGYWAIGFASGGHDAGERRARAFDGVPMSAHDTFARQWAQLERLGLAPEELPELMDVDTIDDARAVAAAAPGTRFARALASIMATSGAAEIPGELPAA